MRNILFTLFFLFRFDSNAQHNDFENLVFEGSGIRGIAFAGALTALADSNLLPKIKRAGGTSGGAIVAMLFSIGYTGKEIEDIIGSTAFAQFNDGRFSFFGGIHRLTKYYGWYRGDAFRKWLAKRMEMKTSNPNLTFQQLHDLAQKDNRYKDLYVTGTCLNKQTMVVFSFESYPKMKITDAVRISMSIPLYFEAVFMNAAGSVFYHPRNKRGLDVMVDGGIISNFPIRLFDSVKYISSDERNGFAINERTLAFRIDSDEQIQYDRECKGLAPLPFEDNKGYMQAFYNMVIENLNRPLLTIDDWQRTVSISDGNFGPRIRQLTPVQKRVLIENGNVATRLFLQKPFVCKGD